MKQLIIAALLCASLVSFAQDTPAKQCKDTTVKGVQCRNRAKANTDYCHLHNPDIARCGATTSKGQPCKNPVKAAGQKCWRHSGS